MSQNRSSPDWTSQSILGPQPPGSPSLLDSPEPVQDREPLHQWDPDAQAVEDVENDNPVHPEPNGARIPDVLGISDEYSNDSSSTVTYNNEHGSVYETGDDNTRDSNTNMESTAQIEDTNSTPTSAFDQDSNPTSAFDADSNPTSAFGTDSRPTSTFDADSSPTSAFDEDSNALSIPSIPREESNISAPSCHDRNKLDCDEPPAKLRKVSLSTRPEEQDGETCPICLDSWGNSGAHRLVALKCGHLFGSECVERWLKAQSTKERSCPTCKSKASLKDVRFIYARRLVAADTSEITTLQKQVDVLKEEIRGKEFQLERLKIAHRACSLQLDVLRDALMKSQVSKEHPTRKSWRFALEKNLEIYKDGGCRVMTYNCRTYELYVSQKSMNQLFPGYGIRKVSCVDYNLGQFVYLHPKPIRDITYSQPRDLLLSVGLDSTARIVDRGIPNVTINSGFPLWSCSWDYLRTNEFYVGGVGGMVHQYDIRNTSTYLATLQAPGDISPVVSLSSTEFGLLSCHLNSCWLWVGGNRQWEPRAFPVDGSFMSMSYDSESQRALISIRPSVNGTERSKLTVCKLKTSMPSGEILIDIEDNFNGSVRSSLMSRATWVKAPGAAWVAAHSESDSTLYLHGLDGVRTMSLPAAEPAIDICSVQLNGNSILAALSESRLRLYKAVVSNY